MDGSLVQLPLNGNQTVMHFITVHLVMCLYEKMFEMYFPRYFVVKDEQ